MIYYVIDAFTNKKFGGNPAGVVIHESADEQFMQAFAAEVRFSETAFIKRIDSKTFEIRFFTPNTEVDLCGHATIAAFKALLHQQMVQDNTTYYMKTAAGTLPVEIHQSIITMEQGEPLLGATIENVDELAELFHIDPSLIGCDQFNLVPQVASTGLWDIMLPIKTKEALFALNPNFKAITAYTEKHSVAGIHAFTLDTTEAIAESRNFCPLYDIDEEAATGTSTGALTYYLFAKEVIQERNQDLTFLQGNSMGRPSTIITKITTDNPPKIRVGGYAVILTKGDIY